MRTTQELTLEIINSVRLTFRFDMTVDEFFQGDGVTNFIDRLAA